MDQFISPLISLVVKEAANSLIQQFCQMSGMEDNCQKLRRQLLLVQEIIADAERRRVDSAAVQEWIKELHAAAYQAVDVLDELRYEALRQKAIREQPSSSAKVVKSFFSSENPIFFRQKISGKLTKVLEMIDKIVIEMDKFKFVHRDPVPPIDRETHSFVTELEVFGRDSERENIINTLLDPQREKENISVLPIVGMGGLGKTTLAQLVYNQERVQNHFQLLMWICVSTEFNITSIIKSIIQVARDSADLSSCSKEMLQKDLSSCSKEMLQKQIRVLLDKKKYLLVLDDVWNEEREKWDELKTLLFSGVGSGSVILVTTRSKAVALLMGTLQSHDVTSLGEEDSWRLFEKRAFALGVKEPLEEFVAIGRTIVSKCAGLPLAVKAMGGLMGTKSNVHDWRVVAENKIWESSACSKDILPILKLSYDNLPQHIQQCFAFCAVFPQDYFIDRNILIRLWMANDFIPTDGTMDLEDKGQHIFNELCWRSFFHVIKEEEGYYGYNITCKMHDLMHDLATEVTEKKCSSTTKLSDLAQKEVQHISLSRESLAFPIPKPFPNIRTLIVKGRLNQTKKHLNFMKSSSLRALALTIDVSPPKELGYMRHLRYLDISFSKFDTLPKSVSKLYNLQTLDLSFTSIRELPEEMRYMTNLRDLSLTSCYILERLPRGMRYMTNLRHLCLFDCQSLKYILSGFGQLKFLRTLTKFIVDPDRGAGIGELKNLNDLCGLLRLSGLEKVRDKEDAEEANLVAKSNIYSLQLEWDQLSETSGDDQAVLKGLRPHSGLKRLVINGFCGSSFPNWMKESSVIKNLNRLSLAKCINCVEIPPLWQLPLLEEVHLQEMKNLKFFVGGTCRLADGSELFIKFPCLKVLTMNDMPNLENWHERDYELVDFPNLNELKIVKCHKLNTIPVHSPLLANLKIRNSNGIKLHQISNIPMLSYLGIEAGTCTLTEIDAFRPPETLEEMKIVGFENCNPLEEDESKSCHENRLRKFVIKNSHCFFSRVQTKSVLTFWKQYFAALEDLSIEECNALVYWPEDELRSLKCLKALSILRCKNFTGSSSVSPPPTPRGEDSLPKLESLMIGYCPELVEVPICSTSLEALRIYDCPKLSRKGLSGLTDLTKLKTLSLESCTNLRAWLDNIHVPSLEVLWIEDSPGLESFPAGLQQHLPSLRSLWIEDCPALERRCMRGGEYWHLVSSIPNLTLLPEKKEEPQSIFTRLLPICRS